MAGDHEAALRHAVPVVRAGRGDAAELFVLGRALVALGEPALAYSAYDVALARAIDSGNLALSVACCADLADQGQDAAQRFDEVAAAFARGSKRISPGAPPAMPGAAPETRPLAAGLGRDALVAEARAAIDQATLALETDRSGSGVTQFRAQPLFSALGQDALRAIVEAFEPVVLKAESRIIEQGTVGAEAYVLGRGELEVVRDDRQTGEPVLLARLGAGALIGEMSLLSRSPRAAHVIAKRPSVLLVAHKESLDAIAARSPELAAEFAEHCHRRMLENLMRHSPILGAVDTSERPAVMEKFVPRAFEQGQRLITQGESSEGMHLIASGEIAVVHREADGDTEIARLGIGDSVGEVALVLRRAANADVVAVTPTITLHLPQASFMDVVRKHPTLLAELYEIAVKRDEETSSIAAQQATDVDDLVLV